MKPLLKKAIQGILWGLAAIVLIGCAYLANLIYIRTPASVGTLQFRGFVLLPKGARLTVLDYLTIHEQRLFVTDESSGSVYRLTLRGNELPRSEDIAAFTGEPATHGVAFDPAQHVAFVSRSEVNVVDVFDPQTMKAIARTPVPDDPDAIFYDDFAGMIYLANGDAHVATLIDPKTHAVVAEIPLGGKPEFSVSDPQSHWRYQNLRDTNSVAAVDLVKRSVAGRWTLTGCVEPAGMAMDTESRRLFIGCAGNSQLVVFDLTKQKVVATAPVGDNPDSVAFDAELHRIYTAGKAGVLTVVQQHGPDAYGAVDSISLHYGAHTLAIDPTTHNLYVGYASLLARSRIAMFAPSR